MQTTTVKTKIAEKLSSASETIATLTIDKIADGIIKERTDIICRAISVLERFEKRLANLIPDVITYNVASVKSESFSESRFNERAEVSKKIAELQTATDLALKENTESVYSTLNDMLNNEDALGFKPHGVEVRVPRY
jgi:hypothetical protein